MNNPAHTVKDSIERRIVAAFVVSVVILVVMAVTTVQNIRRSIASSDWVNHTHAVILEADAIVSSMHAGEAALRNYLLTADARDLAAARQAFSDMAEHLEVGKALTRMEPAQQRRFTQIEPLVARRVDFARQAVHARQQQNEQEVRRLAAADSADTTPQQIKEAMATLKRDEEALLHQRDEESFRSAQFTRWTVTAGLVLNVLLLVFSGWLIRDDLRARRLAASALQAANAQLETKVAERTRDLKASNEALELENLERLWQQQSLEHQLRYNQLVFDSLNDPVFVTTRTLNIARLNPAALRRAGREARELVGTPLRQVLRGDDEAAGGPVLQERLIRALAEERELHDCPAVLVANSGQTTPVFINLFPVRDHGKIVGAVVTVRPAGGT